MAGMRSNKLSDHDTLILKCAFEKTFPATLYIILYSRYTDGDLCSIRYTGRRNKCEPDLPSSSSNTSDEDMKKTATTNTNTTNAPPTPSSLRYNNNSSSPPSSSNFHGHRSSGTTAFPFPQQQTPTASSVTPLSRWKHANNRIQSDSCAQEISSVESSHFKRLLIPTRSDSADDVFEDISACEAGADGSMVRDSYVKILPLREIRHRSSRGPGSSPLTSPKLPLENLNQQQQNGHPPQSPLSTATKFLFDTKVFQETKENITSAIESRLSSSGSEEKSSSLWDLIFGGSKSKQEEMEQEEAGEEVLVHHTNALCNGNSLQDVFISNGANNNKILTSSSTLTTLESKRLTFSRTQSLDRDATLCVLQKTNRQLSSYSSRHSPLVGSNQPVVCLNPMTAQGQVYRKPCHVRKSPLVSPVDSLSSSNESLSAIPVIGSSSRRDNTDKKKKSSSVENDAKPTDVVENDLLFAKCKPKKRTKSEESDQDLNDECVTANSSTDVIDTNGVNGDIADNSKPSPPHKGATKSILTNGNHAVKHKKPSPTRVNGTSATAARSDQTRKAGSDSRKASSDSRSQPAAEDLSEALRYYHVFREHELVDLIEKHVDNLHIIRTYYDHANWCVIAEKVEVWRM